MAVLGLADYTFQYNNLVFGDGTGYYVDHHEGLEGFDVRVSDSDQPRNDGGIRGLDYVSTRLVAFTLALGETTDTAYETRWGALRTAFVPARSADMALTFKRPGMPERFVNCRPITLTRAQEYLQFDQVGHPLLVMRAVDPRIYSSVLYSTNATVYALTGGGFDWPVVNWPIDFTGAVQNFASATNSGSVEAYPLLRFYGPIVGTCTAVTLTNITNGSAITVTTSISTGQILTADMSAAVTGSSGSIIDLGGSGRYGSWAVPRTPFSLSPGNNTLKFQVTGTSTDCLCNVTWRDTWMD